MESDIDDAGLPILARAIDACDPTKYPRIFVDSAEPSDPISEAFEAWNDAQDALEFEDAEAEAHALFIFRSGWKAARAALTAEKAAQEPVARRIFDGEGNYSYTDEAPARGSVEWAAKYGRKYEPLYAHPAPSAPAQSRGDAEQADEAVTVKCELCAGVGQIGTPGQRCFSCDGSGNSKHQGLYRLPDNFKTQLTAFGMLVRALRIVAGTTLYDMAKALSSTPATLSAIEFGRKPLTDAMVADTAAFFSSLGVHDTLHALNAARAKDSK